MAEKRRPKVNFKKAFDWFSFNRTFLEPARGHRIAIAIDPCYIPKSGKKTPGVDWFWSGCASAMKKGLEILGISIVDALFPEQDRILYMSKKVKLQEE